MYIRQSPDLPRRPFGGVFSEAAFVWLLLTVLLFPVAHLSLFGLPVYWSETALGFSFLSLLMVQGWDHVRLQFIQLLKSERVFFFYTTLFLTGIVIATLSNPQTLSGWGAVKSFYIVPVFFLIAILWFGNTKERLELFALAWLFGIGAASVASLIAAFSGWFLFDGRLAGTYLSPNYLALLVAPGVFLVVYFFLSLTRDSVWRLGGLTLLAITIFATLWLTRSYTAWASIGLVLGGVLFFKKGVSRASILLLTLPIFLIGAFFFQEHDGKKWESLISGDPRSSLASRQMIWRSAIKIAEDSFPLGIGAGRFQEMYLAYQPQFPPYLEWAVPTAHNLLLHFLLEGGLLTLIGWIGCVSVLAIRFFRQQTSQGMTRSLSYAALAALLFAWYLVAGLVDTPYMKNDLALAVWGTLGLFLAALRLRV